MAIRHHHTILCDHIIEAKNGQASLIGLYSNIRLDRVPGGLIRMWVHIEMDADVGDTFQVRVEDADGAEIFRVGEGTITEDLLANLQGARPGETTQVGHINITASAHPALFPHFGRYFVVLAEGERVVHRRELAVVPLGKGDPDSD